jgi:hypothetical protein
LTVFAVKTSESRFDISPMGLYNRLGFPDSGLPVLFGCTAIVPLELEERPMASFTACLIPSLA